MAASRHSAAFLWIAILFALFILLVVILADLGLVGQIFGWLYSFPNGDKVGHFDRSASYLNLAASLAGIFLLGELGSFLKHRLNVSHKGA